MGFPRESKIWSPDAMSARFQTTWERGTYLAGVNFGDGHGDEDGGLRRGEPAASSSVYEPKISFPTLIISTLAVGGPFESIRRA